MANQTLTSAVVTKNTLADYENKLTWGAMSYRGWEREFDNNEYQKGDTVNVRLPVQYFGQEGQVLDIQDTVETSTPFTIQYQPGARIGNFTSKSLTLDYGEFDKRYTNPLGTAIANEIDKFISVATEQSSNFYLLNGSLNAATVNNVRAFMNKLAIPTDMRYLTLNFNDSANLANSLNNNFSNTAREEALYKGYIANLADFDITETTHVVYHTSGIGAGTAAVAGLIDGGTVATAAVSSGNTIDVTGLATTPGGAKAFAQGDVIEIRADGLRRLNPKSFIVTDLSPQFVVTADALVDGSGNATITVSPAIITDAANPQKNINIAIPIGATIHLAASHYINLAWNEYALATVSPKLEMPWQPVNAHWERDPQTKWPLRISYNYAQREDQNALRSDCLLGVKLFPRFCTRVIVIA